MSSSRPTQLPVLFWRPERGTDVPLNCSTIPPARTPARTSARTSPRIRPTRELLPRLVAGAQPAVLSYKARVHTRLAAAAGQQGRSDTQVPCTSRWWWDWVSWQVSLTIPSPWALAAWVLALALALTLTLAALLLSPLPSKTPTAGPSQSSPPASATPRLPPQAPHLLLLPLRPHPLPSYQLLQTVNSPKRRPVRRREKERVQTQPPDLVLISSRAARFSTLHQSVSWHTLHLNPSGSTQVHTHPRVQGLSDSRSTTTYLPW